MICQPDQSGQRQRAQNATIKSRGGSSDPPPHRQGFEPFALATMNYHAESVPLGNPSIPSYPSPKDINQCTWLAQGHLGFVCLRLLLRIFCRKPAQSIHQVAPSQATSRSGDVCASFGCARNSNASHVDPGLLKLSRPMSGAAGNRTASSESGAFSIHQPEYPRATFRTLLAPDRSQQASINRPLCILQPRFALHRYSDERGAPTTGIDDAYSHIRHIPQPVKQPPGYVLRSRRQRYGVIPRPPLPPGTGRFKSPIRSR